MKKKQYYNNNNIWYYKMKTVEELKKESVTADETIVGQML